MEQSITFFSPQDGVVNNLNIREGFYVQPGTTLFSIGALDNVWVEAEVFERQAALVKKGAPVLMTLDYLPGKIWEGAVGETDLDTDKPSNNNQGQTELDF